MKETKLTGKSKKSKQKKYSWKKSSREKYSRENKKKSSRKKSSRKKSSRKKYSRKKYSRKNKKKLTGGGNPPKGLLRSEGGLGRYRGRDYFEIFKEKVKEELIGKGYNSEIVEKAIEQISDREHEYQTLLTGKEKIKFNKDVLQWIDNYYKVTAKGDKTTSFIPRTETIESYVAAKQRERRSPQNLQQLIGRELRSDGSKSVFGFRKREPKSEEESLRESLIASAISDDKQIRGMGDNVQDSESKYLKQQIEEQKEDLRRGQSKHRVDLARRGYSGKGKKQNADITESMGRSALGRAPVGTRIYGPAVADEDWTNKVGRFAERWSPKTLSLMRKKRGESAGRKLKKKYGMDPAGDAEAVVAEAPAVVAEAEKYGDDA